MSFLVPFHKLSLPDAFHSIEIEDGVAEPIKPKMLQSQLDSVVEFVHETVLEIMASIFKSPQICVILLCNTVDLFE